jgi:hypothetical protein
MEKRGVYHVCALIASTFVINATTNTKCVTYAQKVATGARENSVKNTNHTETMVGAKSVTGKIDILSNLLLKFFI